MLVDWLEQPTMPPDLDDGEEIDKIRQIRLDKRTFEDTQCVSHQEQYAAPKIGESIAGCSATFC